MLQRAFALGGAILVSLVIFAFAGLGNLFALAAIGALFMLTVIFSPLRVFTIPLAFFLDHIVISMGYGTNTIVGLRAGYFDIFLVLCCSYYFVENMVQTHRLRVKLPNLWLWAFWILLGVVNIALFHNHLSQSMSSFQYLFIEPPLIVFAAVYTVRSRRDLLLAVFGTGLVLFGANLFYIRQFYQTTGSLMPGSISALIDVKHEVSGTMFGNKNVFGAVNLVLALVVFFVGRVAEKRYIRWTYYTFALSGLLIVLMMLSRGVILSMTLAFVLVTLIDGGKIVEKAITLFIAFLGVFSLMVATGVFELFQSRFAEGDIARLELLHQALVLIARFPVFGVGLHEFYFQDAMQDLDLITTHFIFAHPHNSYLQAAVFVGVPGLFVLVTILFRTYTRVFRERLSDDGRYIRTAFLMAMTAFLIDSGSDFLLFNVFSAHAFWFVAGMATAWVYWRTSEAPDADVGELSLT